jgi:subtilase family serine protease
MVSGSSFLPVLEGHVRKGKLTALTVGVAALAAGVVATVAPAGSAATKSAATAAPTIAIAPGVIHPTSVMATPSQANCVKYGYYHCLTPGQVEDAYNLPPLYSRGVTGKGETIVIVDSFGSPTISRDLAVFDKQFNLPAPPSLKVITPSGKIPKWNSGDSDMTGWGGETTLDVEYAHTIAPGASILLVETPVSETEGVTGFPQIVEAENYVLKHHLGDVISQSFSATEQTFSGGLKQINQYHLRSAYVTASQQKNGPTVLAASGDSGVADVKLNGSTYYPFRVTSWPDSDPLVTGVGGTELVAGSHGTFTSVAWNDTDNKHLGDGTVPYATGGGLSVLFDRPAYQNGVKNVVGSARGVPDVSMSGSCSAPVFTYQSFPQAGTPAGWYPSCGTSEATPEFAGIVALADQVAGHALGVINPTLYKLSAAKAPGIVPVTSGNNTVTFVQNKTTYKIKGFPARAGYSLDDGVGTVNAWYLAYELAGKIPPK